MPGRSSRVLWLLQHKTLMRAEVPILRRLGYEVFVPKIYPRIFRSAAVTYEFDASLSIPRSDLDALNAVDFYQEGLPGDIAGIMNEHFAAAFFFRWQGLHVNVMRNFRGASIFRAFGTPAPDSYYRQLLAGGNGGPELVHELGDRFWFGAGYPMLAEAEPPLLASRSTYLPIALPDSFANANRDTWVGGSGQILFLCADINVHPTRRAVYDHFKRNYGHLPHVIVGGQNAPIDDPNVLGFVSDDELVELMRVSSALVYTSREPRHVQYHPIEASVIGLPVVFYRDSLLGALLESSPAGAVESDEAGAALAERLIRGDLAAVESVRREQGEIARRFSEAWAGDVWRSSIDRSGIGAAMASPPTSRDLRHVDTADPTRFIPSASLIVPGEPANAISVRDDVDFRLVNLAPAISSAHGLGEPEAWGRWVHGTTATMLLGEPLHGELEVELVGGTVGEHFGSPIEIELGDGAALVRFGEWVERPETVRATISVTTPSSLLVLRAARVFRDDVGRPLSFGLTRLVIRRRPTRPQRVARAAAERIARTVGGLNRLARRALRRVLAPLR